MLFHTISPYIFLSMSSSPHPTISSDPFARPREALKGAVSSNHSCAVLFLFTPGQAVVCPLFPAGSRALSDPNPIYSPLVLSRFLPWLTGSYISNRFYARSLVITMTMETARTSEMMVNFHQTTQHYNP
jgi:hypothetical protein